MTAAPLLPYQWAVKQRTGYCPIGLVVWSAHLLLIQVAFLQILFISPPPWSYLSQKAMSLAASHPHRQNCCCGLDVHVPLKSMCWNPNPTVIVWGGCFESAWVMRLEPSWMGSVPSGNPLPLNTTWGHSEPGASSKHEICRHLALALPRLQTVEN